MNVDAQHYGLSPTEKAIKATNKISEAPVATQSSPTAYTSDDSHTVASSTEDINNVHPEEPADNRPSQTTAPDGITIVDQLINPADPVSNISVVNPVANKAINTRSKMCTT